MIQRSSPPEVSQLQHIAFDPQYVSAAMEYMAINTSNGVDGNASTSADEVKEKIEEIKVNGTLSQRRKSGSKDINDSSRGMRDTSPGDKGPQFAEGDSVKTMFKMSGVRQTPAQLPEVNGDWRAVYNVISENVNEITNNIIFPAVDYGSKNIIVPALDYGQSLVVDKKESDRASTPDNTDQPMSGRRDLVDPKTMEAINEGVSATADAIMELWTPIQETVNTYAEAAFSPASYNQQKPKLVDLDDFRDKINAITIDNIDKKAEAYNVNMSSFSSQDAIEALPVYRNLTVEKIFDSNSRIFSMLLNINHSLQRHHSDVMANLDDKLKMKEEKEEMTVSEEEKTALRFEAHCNYVAEMDKISTTTAVEEAYNKLLEIESILFKLKNSLQNANITSD